MVAEMLMSRFGSIQLGVHGGIGKVGDFAQGTFGGGAKALMDTAKGTGGVEAAAGAVSQLKDTASFSGIMIYNNVDGRLDAQEISISRDKK